MKMCPILGNVDYWSISSCQGILSLGPTLSSQAVYDECSIHRLVVDDEYLGQSSAAAYLSINRINDKCPNTAD